MKPQYKNNNQNYICLFLFILLIINIAVCFYFKNTTHKFEIKNIQLEKDIIEEQRRLSLSQSNFNKKSDINSLRELSKKLNLQFSNIQQVKEINDITHK